MRPNGHLRRAERRGDHDPYREVVVTGFRAESGASGRCLTSLPYGPVLIDSVMVLVYVPAWVFAGMVSHHQVPSTMAPMPVVGAALATEAGVQVVLLVPHDVGIVTGRGTEFVGSVQDEPPPQSTSVSESFCTPVSLTSNRDPSLQGDVAVHFAVPVESVNGVAEAVRFQPVPDPVASTAVIVAWRCTMVSNPERESDHLIVDGAPTASEPGVTVADPVMLHSGDSVARTKRPCWQGAGAAEPVEDTRTTGPTASAPTTNIRPAHLADL